MAHYDELPVYKATYDLLLEMFRFTKDFTKEYKYTVSESLKKETNLHTTWTKKRATEKISVTLSFLSVY